jgi:hypothetical protein
MKSTLYLVMSLLLFATAVPAQTIPKVLWGKWVVRRDLPTTTISCWGESDARKLIGTEIEYSADLFRWQKVIVKHPTVEVKIVTSDQFANDNSAMDANGSQVDFRQIGIKTKNVQQISIQHPPARITGATIEIPGDEVWVKNPSTIIFAVCNVYFEARRIKPKSNQAGP